MSGPRRVPWSLILPVVVVLLICGMAMRVTGKDNECSAEGGRLEWAANRDSSVCVRDGVVINP